MKLNDVCEVITCGVAKRPNYVEDGIPFLSSKNVKEDRFILDSYNYVSREDYLKLTKHNKPEKGDILYTRVGSFGQAAVIDFDFEFAVFVSLTLIKPKKEIVDSRYLMHYLNNPFIRNLANNSTSGIGVQNLNVKAVREFPIELPLLKTQQRIAAILDDAAALRDKTLQLLKEYDLLAQSIFLEMFGDPVVNQKNFKIDMLSQYGVFKNGLNFNKNESGFKLKCLGVGDFKSRYRFDDIHKLSSVNLAKLPSDDYLLKEGDLVFVRSNGNRALVGRCLSIYPKKEKVTFSGFCIRFRPNNKKLNSIFLAQLFQNNRFKQTMLNNGRGAGIQNINQKILGELKIIMPAIELQNQFSDKIALIEQQKALAKQELQESEDLFNCLLQKAFKGELV